VKFLNQRENRFLKKLMADKDLSAGAVMRQAFRIYQTVDHFLRQGYKLAFLNPATGLYVTPLDKNKKKAPSVPCGRCPHSIAMHDETGCNERVCDAAGDIDWCACSAPGKKE